jgi:hypothetical protein
MTRRWRVDVWFFYKEEARLTSTEIDARSAAAALMRVFNQNRGKVLVSRSYRIEVREMIVGTVVETTSVVEGEPS